MYQGTGNITLTLTGPAILAVIRNIGNFDITATINSIAMIIKNGEQLTGSFNSFSNIGVIAESNYEIQAITEGGALLL